MHRKDFLQALGFGLGWASPLVGWHGEHVRCAGGEEQDDDDEKHEGRCGHRGHVNVTALGATGDGATNDAPALQNVFNTFNNSTTNPGGGGALYFPKGYYLCTSDINYFLNSRSEGGSILLQGDGVDNTFIHFKGADFTDGMVSQGWEDWDTGWTQLVIKDMTLKFDGDSDTGKGRWKGQLTMPHMDSVRLRTGGYYQDLPGGSTILDLGRGPGPAGQTCIWRSVMYEPHAETGTSLTFLALHYDTFLWLGGGIVAGFASGVADPHLFNLRPVYTAVLDSLSDFVPRGTTNPALYALVAVTEPEGQIIFRNCHIANYTAHFQNDSVIPPVIHLIDCSSEKWPLILSKTQDTYSLPIMKYDNNRGWVNKNGGTLSVAHGGTIAHGLASMPTRYGVTGTVAGHVATVTSVDATTLTIGLTDSHGYPVTSPEQVAWWAEF
jgi:Pectate lyase superfamily protein